MQPKLLIEIQANQIKSIATAEKLFTVHFDEEFESTYMTFNLQMLSPSAQVWNAAELSSINLKPEFLTRK